MKYLWYKTVRLYVKFGLRSYFKTTKVEGFENIPKDQPVLFVGNHRNGLIDPIMVATTSHRVHLFLTRASAFKNPIANFLLRSINMIPIYRIRDGVNTIKRNQEIFNACHDEFNMNGSVLMFPEGNHGLFRRLRPLTKGFARIAFGYFDTYPDAELQIIPVGLNYSDMQEKGSSVSVYYGKPISVREYYDPKDEIKAIEKLKDAVSEKLKTLTTHIDSEHDHEIVEKVLIQKGINFLDPIKSNKTISEITNWDVSTKIPKPKKSLWKYLVKIIFTINTFIPIIIWNRLKHKPKDIVLIPTFRYGLSVGLIPLFYILQSILAAFFSTSLIGFGYFVVSILLLLLYKNSIYTDSVTTYPS
ncbi:MAG: 1-acyl-sn-glycerol-3-phosphate acyltransferase [Bacteroidales bacterium]|nr:1-acyl-sn-glycerol-3-phosphate acyltransferase [Bacteroidales bacterium]